MSVLDRKILKCTILHIKHMVNDVIKLQILNNSDSIFAYLNNKDIILRPLYRKIK